MAVLAIGVVAALLVVLTLGFALLVEIRSVRREIAHGNKTQHRIALVEGGRYRDSKRVYGERAGRRADHEIRIGRYSRDSRDKLESIRALLAGALAASERAESASNEEHHQGEPARARATSDSDEGRLHSELAPARVAKAAQEIKERRAAKRATTAASERVAFEQPATIGGEEDEDPDAGRVTSEQPEAPSAVAASTEIEIEEEATTI